MNNMQEQLKLRYGVFGALGIVVLMAVLNFFGIDFTIQFSPDGSIDLVDSALALVGAVVVYFTGKMKERKDATNG